MLKDVEDNLGFKTQGLLAEFEEFKSKRPLSKV
jgi:hypothetical protein